MEGDRIGLFQFRIIYFCNRRFGLNVKEIGKVDYEETPVIWLRHSWLNHWRGFCSGIYEHPESGASTD
jgi:hypothetical protein